MTIKTIIFVLAILSAVSALPASIWLKDSPYAKWAIILSFVFTVSGLMIDFVDTWAHGKVVRKILPHDLDFYSNHRVEFDKDIYIPFESNDVKISFKITRIYKRRDDYFVISKYDLEDKKRNTRWIDQVVEVRINEGVLVKGKTDRLDIYFYVAKTRLGNADLTVGFKIVERGIIVKNLIISGRVFKF